MHTNLEVLMEFLAAEEEVRVAEGYFPQKESELYHQYIPHMYQETLQPHVFAYYALLASRKNLTQVWPQSLHLLLQWRCPFDHGVQNCKEHGIGPNQNPYSSQETNKPKQILNTKIFTPLQKPRKQDFSAERNARTDTTTSWRHVFTARNDFVSG